MCVEIFAMDFGLAPCGLFWCSRLRVQLGLELFRLAQQFRGFLTEGASGHIRRPAGFWVNTTRSKIPERSKCFSRSARALRVDAFDVMLRCAGAQFIQSCDLSCLATVSETGWPYMQHRGGMPGFLPVVSPT